MRVLKSTSYSNIENPPFALPLPLKFELFYADFLLASYDVDAGEHIKYEFDETLKIPIITSMNKDLSMDDIYFLFNCRVFQEYSPYAPLFMQQLRLEEYNQYQIIRKTHGIVPGDYYWIRFDGEELEYADAVNKYNMLFTPPYPNGSNNFTNI